MRGLPNRRWLLIIAAAVAALACRAGGRPSASATPDDPAAKIDPAVLASIDSGHAAQVILLGSSQLIPPGQFDAFRREHDGDDRLVLRREVVASLKRIARNQQRVILARLGVAAPERALWIVNALLVTLTPTQVRRAASLPDVRFIYPAADTVRPQQSPGRFFRIPATGARAPLSAALKRIGWNVVHLDVPRVWDELHDAGEGVIVASLDLGVNYAHDDIRSNIWINRRELPGNGRDDDGNGYIDDLYGYDFHAMSPDVRNTQLPMQHGTMTSGIIVGDGTDGIVTGVAPRARLMILEGLATTEAALAYQYAIENGADVFSMSFSLPGLGNTRGIWRMMSDDAVAAGLVLVGGAGNFRATAKVPDQIWTPKDVPSVIAVGGVDTMFAIRPYSSGGPVEWGSVALFHDYPPPLGLVKPDVAAFSGPGYPVLSAVDTGYVDPNNHIAGNSFSGPQAAGVAALMLSAAPRLPAWKVKEIMESSARRVGAGLKNNDTGSGVIDAFAAVLAARAALR